MLITDSPDWSNFTLDQLIAILETRSTLCTERKKIRLTIMASYIKVFPNIREPFDKLVEEIKSRDIVIDEVLRQRELRFLKHRKEWHCDPTIKTITEGDIHHARAYLNTVEDWSGW
jgi:hypothetical protein